MHYKYMCVAQLDNCIADGRQLALVRSPGANTVGIRLSLPDYIYFI